MLIIANSTSKMAVQEDLVIVEPPSLPTWKAPSPFDRNDANLVLRASDRVDFLVHGPILVIASPFFESMLSELPQPPADPDQTLGKPIIDISEDARTTEAFLRFIYPTLDPDVEELSLLRSVLAAGVKYKLSVVVAAVKKTMVSPRFLKSHPIDVFAIACRYQFEVEAKAAAHRLEKHSWGLPTHSGAGLDELNAGQYFRLLQFELGRDVSTFCHSPVNPSALSPMRDTAINAAIDVAFPFTGPDGDLILRSCDSRNFYVHRAIIALASPEMLDGSLKPDTTDAAAIPIYQMQEDSVCVDILLRLCYPVTKSEFSSAQTYGAVLVAARKYQLREVERLARVQWKTFVTEDSDMSMYFLAVELGWKEEAVTCAQHIALQGTVEVRKLSPRSTKKAKAKTFTCPAVYTQYIPSMESISSVPYRNLLSYVNGYRKAATSILHLSDLPVDASSMQLSLDSGPSASVTPYPAQISTGAPPPWLLDQFTNIKHELEKRPSSDILAIGTPLWYSFITFVMNNKPPGQDYINPPSDVRWAATVLQRYAEAIDWAISKVNLRL
ncbi:hypothetical protein GSI_12639 [Ganoderma sinense ZZ0214-1]|uniref:BTB domain-containing protein n=1 Tax=Ganoderma sinense ZZ0214-1 TaxID=1077348 RepID=A0A2G8RTD6_9APHY|nr:hypothetical protein GSI_12639 [Ganoderma sinense ZZ0214-1]